MNGGYVGKILNVDLTRETIDIEDLSEETARQFIGTYGLGARVLYSRMKAGTDPLGPGSVLGFVTGPLTGTGALFGGRFVVVCKSPVNGGWNDSNCGGHFGPQLKKAGFDAVFISGISDHPVSLWIVDGNAELRDASHLWGRDVHETEALLAKEAGNRKVSSVVIGPPGESQAWMAAIINDGHRAAARGGPGAVMGSKKLKAIVAWGNQKIRVANEQLLKEVNQSVTDLMKNGPQAGVVMGFGQQGTGMANVFSVMMGDTPIKNWGGAGMVDFFAENLDVGEMDEKYKRKRYACANCPMGCGADYEVGDGEWPVGETNRPEYETVGVFGGLVLNENREVILKCNHICNQYGLDTISTGATIAWAIECYENGLITKQDTDGLELTWGNGQDIVNLTQMIAEQKGFGRVLANGSQAAARALNRGFEYLQTVRGIELPMHDPKFTPGYARTYQADPTPARHTKGGPWLGQMMLPPEEKYNYEDTGPADLQATAKIELADLVGMCEFAFIPDLLDEALRYMEAVVGWKFGNEERINAVLRSLHMRQAFNLREGILPKDSILPPRAIGNPPLEAGPTAGITINVMALVRNFYQTVEWDEETGKPACEALERLGGFEDVIQDLYA